jgi:hypothetical protein
MDTKSADFPVLVRYKPLFLNGVLILARPFGDYNGSKNAWLRQLVGRVMVSGEGTLSISATTASARHRSRVRVAEAA